MTSSQRIIKAMGRVVRDARREKGLTQEQLAFESNLNKNHISKIERAQTSASVVVLFTLAKAMGIQPATLMGRIERALK